jgi:hypothetical protein
VSTRFLLLPDRELSSHAAKLETALEGAAKLINAKNFADFAGVAALHVLRQSLHALGADEGTIWLLSPQEDALVPVFNTGPQADEWVGCFQQPLDEGLISMVFASEQPYCENETWQDTRHSKKLDQKLGLTTRAMVAVPFGFAGATRGVLSAVQLCSATETAPASGSFGPESLEKMILCAHLLGALFELRCLNTLFGRA